MASIGPGSYSPQNMSLNHASTSALRLKKNLSTSKKGTFLDSTSNKVIEIASQQGACFGSSQGRFDEQEKLLAKAPSKLGPGAYSRVGVEPKAKNFSTRFSGAQSGYI